MQLDNFTSRETALLTRALAFARPAELDPAVTAAVRVVKTDNFADECDQVALYYAPLGLETPASRPVFDSGRNPGHRILLNKAAISGLSFLHTLVGDLIHLNNLRRYSADHGNVYRFTQEQAIAHAWYEFLLWSRFQALRIATRAHALVSWHEVNGEQPPADGRYRFALVDLASPGLTACLEQLRRAEDLAAWRAGLWDLLQELALYFGRLAFYQRDPWPAELDGAFPAGAAGGDRGPGQCLRPVPHAPAGGQLRPWSIPGRHPRRGAGHGTRSAPLRRGRSTAPGRHCLQSIARRPHCPAGPVHIHHLTAQGRDRED